MDPRQKFLDEFAKLMTDGMGLAHGMAEEAKSFTEAQVERFVHEFQIVRREEFEALEDRVTALEQQLDDLKNSKT